MTLICATITDPADIIQAKADGAEAFEFRLDIMQDVLASKNPESINLSFLNQTEQVIVTCRNDTGLLSDETKQRLFQTSLDNGADYLDIEDDSPLLGKFPGKTICSHHNFKKTPSSSEIVSIFRNLKKYGIPKAAFMVKEISDLKNIADAAEILKSEMDKFIIIGMGITGEITRIRSDLLGSFITYCGVTKEKTTAPGQLTVQETVHLGKSPIVTGIIGWPLTHTFSPAIQNAAFTSANINGRYVKIPVHPDNLNLVPDIMKIYNIKGLNVTIPHKEAILQYLKENSKTVEEVKAANTITNALSGENTDVLGIAATLDTYVHKDTKLLLIGAGGAARAVAWYARFRGCHLTITNRTEDKAELLTKEFGGKVLPLTQISEKYDVIVNATPINPTIQISSPDTVIMDLRYPSSPFLEESHKKGAKITFSGEKMLIYQGLASFKIWTGKEPDITALEEAFQEAKDD